MNRTELDENRTPMRSETKHTGIAPVGSTITDWLAAYTAPEIFSRMTSRGNGELKTFVASNWQLKTHGDAIRSRNRLRF
ncbi:MDR/zinc-dependent alcohol dehydrogenase-like family protein [Paraburkholderia sp. RL17-337-BIB-A]|uniref:hypothetical protein n=1 Tax=Paraburkholderia sp. RL17-337-BIB-A TaxID=3031636 RepID=UPI0038BA7738